MTRSFTTDELVQLPRLSATEAAVLGSELLAVAEREREQIKGKHLPLLIARPLVRLRTAHHALDQTLVPLTPSGLDPQRKRQADLILDNAWSAAFDWAAGWGKLPASLVKMADQVRALQRLVFADRLAFVKLPYKLEWQESRTRLAAIARDGHEATFQALGGKVFLDHLREAHERYGEAIGVTAPVADEQQTRALGEARDAALTALRDYVAKVAAHADADEVGSTELSAALLRPLTAWRSAPVAGAGESEPAPAPVS